MEYIIVSPSVNLQTKTGGYYVARGYIDKYIVRDYIAPIYKDYFGKLGCSQPLTFETIETAQQYIKHNGGLFPNDWKTAIYDPCTNDIICIL